MRSRAARLTFTAIAWLAMAGAGYFLVISEQQLASRRTALRAFDQHARDVAQALADVRAGQQAYVAAGQGVAFWMPKVDALIKQAAATVATLRASAGAADGRQQLVEAAPAIAELNTLDRRARDYIRGGEPLMASDVVFTAGADAATGVAHQVELARLAEYRAFDGVEAEQRRLEAFALGGAAGLSALVMFILALARGPVVVRQVTSVAEIPPVAELPLMKASAAVLAPPAHDPSEESVSALRDAASLCTEFGCLKDAADLAPLLARAADVMDATGLIVWLGSAEGGDLRPVLAHGYAEQTIARIPPVTRSADNAAAAAYRSGSLQIVRARPGISSGAIVAPLLTADGCIGALTAEIRDRGETADGVQALATIVAAQLAGVLWASVGASETRNGQGTAPSSRLASA
jgi:hypothetical protein